MIKRKEWEIILRKGLYFFLENEEVSLQSIAKVLLGNFK